MLRLVYLFWAREAMLRCQEFTLFFKFFFFLMWIIFLKFYLFMAVLDLQASQMALMVKKKPACHCRRCKKHRFDPWVGKIP